MGEIAVYRLTAHARGVAQVLQRILGSFGGAGIGGFARFQPVPDLLADAAVKSGVGRCRRTGCF
jgi:hypothetical protein